MIRTLKTLAVAAAFSLASVAAHAATLVTFENGPDGGGTERFTVSCTVSCEGWLFDAETLGGDIGGLIDYLDQTYALGQGETWEENLLSGITTTLGGGAGSGFVKTDPAIDPFTSSALLELFKIGQTPNVGVLVNTSGGSQTYDFSQIATGSGLSHTASYGNGGGVFPPVPVPASLPLLIGALGVGGLVLKRRKRNA